MANYQGSDGESIVAQWDDAGVADFNFPWHSRLLLLASVSKSLVSEILRSKALFGLFLVQT